MRVIGDLSGVPGLHLQKEPGGGIRFAPQMTKITRKMMVSSRKPNPPNPLKKSSIRYYADELIDMQLQSTSER